MFKLFGIATSHCALMLEKMRIMQFLGKSIFVKIFPKPSLMVVSITGWKGKGMNTHKLAWGEGKRPHVLIGDEHNYHETF